MSKNFRVYFRLKPRNYNTDKYNPNVAQHTTTWDTTSKKTVKHTSISFFLHRMWYSYQLKKTSHPEWLWDTFFSEVASHEYIHKVLVDAGLVEESRQFDTLYGLASKNPGEFSHCGIPEKRKQQQIEKNGMVLLG